MHSYLRNFGMLGAAMVLSLVASGCDDDKQTPALDAGLDAMDDGGVLSASLRFAHFIPGGDPVRVCVYSENGVSGPYPSIQDEAAGLEYQSATAYDGVILDPNERYTITFITAAALGAAGCPTEQDGGSLDTVVEREFDAGELEENTFYTVAGIGSGEPRLEAFADERNVDLENFSVRAVNARVAGDDEGEAVTFCFDAPTTGVEDLGTGGVGFGEATAYEEKNVTEIGADLFAIETSLSGGCEAAVDDNKVAESADFAAAGESVTGYLIGDSDTSSEAFVLIRE